MSDNRVALLIVAVIGLLLVMMLEDRSSCKDKHGDPCKFGGATRGGVGEIKEVFPKQVGNH
jgi:hypothetical protein